VVGWRVKVGGGRGLTPAGGEEDRSGDGNGQR
jgi:hypothetical protein